MAHLSLQKFEDVKGLINRIVNRRIDNAPTKRKMKQTTNNGRQNTKQNSDDEQHETTITTGYVCVHGLTHRLRKGKQFLHHWYYSC